MSRESSDELDEHGCIKNGFDYNLQVWVKDGKVLNCTHPTGCLSDRGKQQHDVWCNSYRYFDMSVRDVPGHQVRKGENQ